MAPEQPDMALTGQPAPGWLPFCRNAWDLCEERLAAGPVMHTSERRVRTYEDATEPWLRSFWNLDPGGGGGATTRKPQSSQSVPM